MNPVIYQQVCIRLRSYLLRTRTILFYVFVILNVFSFAFARNAPPHQVAHQTTIISSDPNSSLVGISCSSNRKKPHTCLSLNVNQTRTRYNAIGSINAQRNQLSNKSGRDKWRVCSAPECRHWAQKAANLAAKDINPDTCPSIAASLQTEIVQVNSLAQGLKISRSARELLQAKNWRLQAIWMLRCTLVGHAQYAIKREEQTIAAMNLSRAALVLWAARRQMSPSTWVMLRPALFRSAVLALELAPHDDRLAYILRTILPDVSPTKNSTHAVSLPLNPGSFFKSVQRNSGQSPISIEQSRTPSTDIGIYDLAFYSVASLNTWQAPVSPIYGYSHISTLNANFKSSRNASSIALVLVSKSLDKELADYRRSSSGRRRLR